MTDLFKQLSSSVKNISATAEERNMRNVKNISIDVNAKNPFPISGPGNKKCKVSFDCTNAKELVKQIKAVLDPERAKYNTSVNSIIKTLQESLAEKNLPAEN